MAEQLNKNILEGIDDIQFGVEFEFLFHPKKLRSFLKANKINTDLSIPDMPEDYSGEDIELEDNKKEAVFQAANLILKKIGLSNWDAKDDASVLDDDGDGTYGVEVVTPPLKGIEGLQQIKKFCDVFSKIGYVNDTCGLHVHVDTDNWLVKNKKFIGDYPEKIFNLLLHFKSFEKLFDTKVAAWRRGDKNEHAGTTSSPGKVIAAYEDTRRYIQDIDNKLPENVIRTFQTARYRKLNLESLLIHGTIEFRQLEGTLNEKKVIPWIVLCLSFLNSAKQITTEYKNIVNELKTKMGGDLKTINVSTEKLSEVHPMERNETIVKLLAPKIPNLMTLTPALNQLEKNIILNSIPDTIKEYIAVLAQKVLSEPDKANPDSLDAAEKLNSIQKVSDFLNQEVSILLNQRSNFQFDAQNKIEAGYSVSIPQNNYTRVFPDLTNILSALLSGILDIAGPDEKKKIDFVLRQRLERIQNNIVNKFNTLLYQVSNPGAANPTVNSIPTWFIKLGITVQKQTQKKIEDELRKGRDFSQIVSPQAQSLFKGTK